MATIIFLLIILILIIGISIISVKLNEIERNCQHEWQLISQRIDYCKWKRTFECKKCKKIKYMEEWDF